MSLPRLFSVPAGAPFLATFADALLAGEIVPGVGAAHGPLSLADLTIFTPTRRAGRALAAEFATRAREGAILLPRIKPLGAPDEEQALFGASAEAADLMAADLPAPIGDMERRLLLSDLVLAWTGALAGAIRGANGDGAFELDAREALVVGASPADAVGLAGELASLIDEFLIEETPWEKLKHLVAEEYSYYWGVTARFLGIAAERWPAILAERGRMEAVARRNELVAREIARFQADGRHEPMVVLGSTGTNKATARLMRAICRLPRGAVVLPGLDQSSAASIWAMIEGEEAPLHSHPQAALARLLKRLNATRESVTQLGARPPALETRVDFVAAALAPGEATPLWRAWRERNADARPLDDVSVIEAADEREEALAIALCLRAALETPGRTAALVAPDRAIARRVRAELRRWAVDVDDSGGDPLSLTPAGALARGALRAAAEECSDVSLAALVAHEDAAPLTDRATTVEASRALELAVWRATFHEADPVLRMERAREAAREPHAHRAARALNEARWRAAGDLLNALHASIAPLRAPGKRPLESWVSAHRAALESLRGQDLCGQDLRGQDLRGDDAREDEDALRALFDALGAGALATPLALGDYRSLFERLASEAVVRGPQRAHPRLKILGPLEARLIEVDLMVIAGLDETVWPPQTHADAFLNRPMRAGLGLPPPERRIGQSAHDFFMAMGAPRVVLARAAKRGGTPTVASRFVQRLATLGARHWEEAVRRGAEWRALAVALDKPARTMAAPRPEPKPALDLRPRQLSVTRIETLRRDPYAIYADRVLKLKPVGPLDSAPGAADLGNAVHAVLGALAQEWPDGPPPDKVREKLVARLREELGVFFADPAWRAFRWPQIEAGVDYVLRYERARRDEIERVCGEIEGEIDIPLVDGTSFRLTARADRIELLGNGAARIVDYKTGQPPTKKQAKAGFASQLTLEAGMLARGAFAGLPARRAEALAYLKFGGPEGGQLIEPLPKGMTVEELIDEHWAQLRRMLDSFRDPARGYRSRPYVQFAGKFGDYDHLARVKEWSAGGAPEAT